MYLSSVVPHHTQTTTLFYLAPTCPSHATQPPASSDVLRGWRGEWRGGRGGAMAVEIYNLLNIAPQRTRS